MGVKCAKCGSHNTAEYLSGMPAMNETLEKDIAEHKTILGGCIVSELSPKFYCNECKKDFGYSAKRQCEGEIVDYIEDTNYFMFSIYYRYTTQRLFACYVTDDFICKKKLYRQ